MHTFARPTHILETDFGQTLESVVENIAQGYVVYDKNWCYVYVNRKAEQIFGYDRSALLGQSVKTLFPQLLDTPIFKAFGRAMETGKEEEVEYFSPVASKWIRTRIIPVKNGLVTYLSDQTEKRQALSDISFLETITHAVSDALIGTDDKYNIISWNTGANKLYGWTKEEVMGKPAGALIPTSFVDNEANWYESVVENGSWQGEVMQKTKNGKIVHVLAHISVIRDADGNPAGFIACNHDLGKSRLAEETQIRLAAIVESSDDAIISKNLNGIVKSWNSGAEKIFGYTAREAIGQHITFLMPDELKHEEEAIIQKIRQGLRVDHYETQRITKYGERIDISLTISPIRNHEGIITGASKIARDITERKRAEKIILESMERLRAMFNQAGVGVCLMTTDYTMREMNPKFCEITGYDAQELTGRSCLEITHSDDQEATRKIMDELAVSARETMSFENRYIRKNSLEVWVRVNMTKIFSAEGTTKQYIAIVEDISEYKRAEAGLRESESRFRILAENIQSLAWMANADGWIFWCNQRWYEYLGASFEAIKGWGWENTIHPDHAEKVHRFLKTAWRKNEPWEVTFPLRGKDGEYRWFLINAFPVRDQHGEVQRWIGTCTDVEEIKKRAQTNQGPNS